MPRPRRPLTRYSLLATAVLLPVALAVPLIGSVPTAAAGPVHRSASAGCQLGTPAGRVQHVIYLQFDNVHFTRDNPNVPSDLEQLPNLMNFLQDNGVLLTQEHTPLIAHTADDIVTSETGVYGNEQGIPIANEYRYYTPRGVTHTAGSFAYWTDPIVDYDTGLASRPVGDHTPTMIDANGAMAPAPWVPYTRSGCNFGAVAAANTELENTEPDVRDVFGAGSPEAKEAANPAMQNKAAADFEGLSIHCAQAEALCSTANGGVADRLPSEPGGYTGYQALFGAKFVDPVISPSGPVRSLYGKVIKDADGDVGFPGYDSMQAFNALAFTADMQEHGVPITYTYLTDLHDSWKTGAGMGPGEARYEAQLRNENTAFGIFFHRLADDGITPANTLFVVTADEGDHFVGGPASPADCNGVTVTCHYSRVGEVNANLNGLLATEQGVTTPFDVEADSAPVLYVHHQPAAGEPEVRNLEQALGRVTALDLATRRTVPLTNYLANPVEMNLEHMLTADPKRTPTVIDFGNTDFWDYGGSPSCSSPCVTEPKGGDAWNHGDVAPEINTTWLGLVGPGVRHLGVDSAVWSSHTDIRPTMLTLLGLHDDYTHEGRTLVEVIEPAASPASLRAHAPALLRLGQVFEQIDSPVGALGLASLKVSTTALTSTSPGDRTYLELERRLERVTAVRNAIAGAMLAQLEGAAFHGRPIDPTTAAALAARGERLIGQVETLAAQG